MAPCGFLGHTVRCRSIPGDQRWPNAPNKPTRKFVREFRALYELGNEVISLREKESVGERLPQTKSAGGILKKSRKVIIATRPHTDSRRAGTQLNSGVKQQRRTAD